LTGALWRLTRCKKGGSTPSRAVTKRPRLGPMIQAAGAALQ
jgi:hypothetical protein